jgi:cytochrome c biogenesis protein
VPTIESAPPPVQNPPIRRRGGPTVPSTDADPFVFALDSVRMAWRWLTRMRTALYLLAGLAIQSAVATVIPQEPNVPATVQSWLSGDEGPGVGTARVIDAFGAFDVYGSTIFLAFLLLMFLSLTACLIPRIRGWLRLVRHSQPPLLTQAVSSDLAVRFATTRGPDEVLDAARALLPARQRGFERWRGRLHGHDPQVERSAPTQLAAETGLWSREGGSLSFHLSFYVLLAAIVFGQLTTFEGQRGVVEGEPGFTDAAVSYWQYAPGRWFDEDQHAGWRLDLDGFEVDWVRDPLAPGAGQPTLFRSAVTITRPDGRVERASVEGNRPLVVDGRKIHQLDWGYAPRIIVRDRGVVVHDAFVTTQDATGLFMGAVKAPAADPDVGLELFLYPFAPDGPQGPRLTGAPWADAPLMFVWQWRGDLQLGLTQQFINELDVSNLDLEGGTWLRPGERVVIGDIEIEFVELRRWVGFQVSRRPGVPWLLLGSAMMTLGLIAALYAYRRRIWVVVDGVDPQGRTLVSVVGRAFQRPDAAAEEHQRIAEGLRVALDGGPAATELVLAEGADHR